MTADDAWVVCMRSDNIGVLFVQGFVEHSSRYTWGGRPGEWHWTVSPELAMLMPELDAIAVALQLDIVDRVRVVRWSP